MLDEPTSGLDPKGVSSIVRLLRKLNKERGTAMIIATHDVELVLPSTPVGIATNAYRQKQEVVVTDLEHMPDYEIGMNTTIFIGNSATFTSARWIVTPRGYRTKYDLVGESTQEHGA